MSFRTKITGLSVLVTMGAVALAISAFILQSWLGDRTDLAQRRLALAQVGQVRVGAGKTRVRAARLSMPLEKSTPSPNDGSTAASRSP